MKNKIVVFLACLAIFFPAGCASVKTTWFGWADDGSSNPWHYSNGQAWEPSDSTPGNTWAPDITNTNISK
jgi:hypothetical protein